MKGDPFIDTTGAAVQMAVDHLETITLFASDFLTSVGGFSFFARSSLVVGDLQREEGKPSNRLGKRKKGKREKDTLK